MSRPREGSGSGKRAAPPTPSATIRSSDAVALSAMQAAIRDFLVAAGLDPAGNPELRQTPELAARAWAEEFLNGYRLRPSEVLAERMPAKGTSRQELVILVSLDYQSVCPHHLLPYRGLAHVAYLPGKSIVGFGQIARLLDCLGHRLVLQEDLARQIAEALRAHLGARGAAAVLEAEQTCLSLRGGRRSRARVVAEAYVGAMEADAELRQRFLTTIRGSGRCL